MSEEKIRITVKAFGSLGELLEPQMTLSSGASVRDFLNELSPKARDVLLSANDPQTVAPGILIFRNDVLIIHQQGLDTALLNGDELFLLFADLIGG